MWSPTYLALHWWCSSRLDFNRAPLYLCSVPLVVLSEAVFPVYKCQCIWGCLQPFKQKYAGSPQALCHQSNMPECTFTCVWAIALSSGQNFCLSSVKDWHRTLVVPFVCPLPPFRDLCVFASRHCMLFADRGSVMRCWL